MLSYRVMANRFRDRSLNELRRSSTSSSEQFTTASATASDSDKPSKRSEPQEGNIVGDLREQVGSGTDLAASGRSRDEQETKKSTRKNSETQGSISAVVTRPPSRSRRMSPQVFSTSSGTSGSSEPGNVPGTSRTAKLPRNHENVSTATFESKSHMSSKKYLPTNPRSRAESSTSSASTSNNGCSHGIITSTPAPDSQTVASQQLGISAITGDYSVLSSVPSYIVAGDGSCKEAATSTTVTFFDQSKSGRAGVSNKRLEFGSDEENAEEEHEEEVGQTSATMTFDINDIPGLEQERSQTPASMSNLPQEQNDGTAEADTISSSVANYSTTGFVDSNTGGLTDDDQLELRHPTGVSLENGNTAGDDEEDYLSTHPENIAQDEEIIGANVIATTVLSDAGEDVDDENDDEDVDDRGSFATSSLVSDGQISQSYSTAEREFQKKCELARAYVGKHNLVVGNVTARESSISGNIQRKLIFTELLKDTQSHYSNQILFMSSSPANAHAGRDKHVSTSTPQTF